MAEIQPLRALHYNTSVVGRLDDVVAPPYDVIDADQRARLIQLSPFNVVAVDLPQGEPDPYESARELFETWQLQGVLVRDREPALWAHTQEYDGPGGNRRRAGGHARRRAGARRRPPPLRDDGGVRGGGGRRGRAPLHPYVPRRARGPRADPVPDPPRGQRPRPVAPGGTRRGAAA